MRTFPWQLRNSLECDESGWNGDCATLLFRSNRERLVGLLCELLEQYGRKIDEGLLIDIKLSHQDLAGLIGITRESVTLTLGELQLERMITVGRQRIVVLNADKLAQAAGEKTCKSQLGNPGAACRTTGTVVVKLVHMFPFNFKNKELCVNSHRHYCCGVRY